ncbi:hypothetical protein AVEN_3105-1 [Araneus ventricosus]|uniref:Uncharacterized protein n=1 Tax=Araneus ventricosus TaxID=182803 RepID=A0A4Y2PB25_ARAVE|nr:hypothetical protein AVEN_3105-1 [Araneus ventricosus]
MYTKWIARRPPKVLKSFRHFGRISVKSAKHAQKLLTKNKALKKAAKKLFSKKGLTAVALAGGISTAAYYINNYIQSNSGCFLTTVGFKGKSVCKVKELSCCQQDHVKNVSNCEESKFAAGNPCNNYDEDKENLCCRHCNCQEYDCLPHQNMECRRPSVGDALTHLTQEVTSHLDALLKALMPWLYTALSVLFGLAVLWIACIAFNKVR